MAINKVVYGTTVLVDLTEDTVTPQTLLLGNRAHGRDGQIVEGTLTGSQTGVLVKLSDLNVTYVSATTALIDISDKVSGNRVFWDVPEGIWSVVVLKTSFRSRRKETAAAASLFFPSGFVTAELMILMYPLSGSGETFFLFHDIIDSVILSGLHFSD